MNLRPYQIETSDGKAIIAVQSCTEEWANIAVFYKNEHQRFQYHHGQVSHQITLPDFCRRYRRHYPNEMNDEVYDAYLKENREALLALIERLNSPDYDYSAHNDYASGI